MTASGDCIWWNGSLVEPHDGLLGRNYVYCTVTTLGTAPLYLEAKLHRLYASCRTLFGDRSLPSATEVREAIGRVLKRNGTATGGNLAGIYLLTGENDATDLLVRHESHSLYAGYELSGLRPRTIVVNYELPFERHFTAVSQIMAVHAQEYALRRRAHRALRADRAGRLHALGEWPLFALCDGRLLCAPDDEVRPTPERDLMLRACRLTGIAVETDWPRVDRLDRYDELIAFTSEGICAVGECDGLRFMHTVAHLLGRTLTDLTREGLAAQR